MEQHDNPLPDDVKSICDELSQTLEDDWFDKIEAMCNAPDNQVDAWIAEIEAKITERKP